MKYKKIILLILITFLPFFILYISFFIYLKNPEYDFQGVGLVKAFLPKNMIMWEIELNRPIGQTFLATNDGLTKIFFGLNLKDEKIGSKITFHLKEIGNDKDTIWQTMDINKNPANEYYYITFEKINNSKDKKYYFYLEPKENNNLVVLWANNKDYYEDGNMVVNEKEVDGDLIFNVAYQNEKAINLFRLLFNRFDRYGINKYLILPLFVIYFVITFVFIWFLLKFFFYDEK